MIGFTKIDAYKLFSNILTIGDIYAKQNTTLLSSNT